MKKMNDDKTTSKIKNTLAMTLRLMCKEEHADSLKTAEMQKTLTMKNKISDT